jgi:uncharacterized protein DUF2336
MPHAHDDERAAAILGRRAEGLLALDEALAELADSDCVVTLATFIAERVGIRIDLVSRALDAPSDETISVMCRVAGFKMNSYSALLRMRRRHNRGADSTPTDALTLFAELSPLAAKQMLARLVPGFGQRRPEIRRVR